MAKIDQSADIKSHRQAHRNHGKTISKENSASWVLTTESQLTNMLLRQAWDQKLEFRLCLNKETAALWRLSATKSTKHQNIKQTFSTMVVSLQVQRKYFHSYLIIFFSNKSRVGSQSNGKAIDFYAGLKLGGPLNKGSKTYVQVTREQQHNLECSDVKSLREWERSILKEVDDKYDPDDDSSDEEAIAYKAAQQAAAKAKEEAEAEQQVASA